MKNSDNGSTSSKVTNAEQRNNLSNKDSLTKNTHSITEDPQEEDFYTQNLSAEGNETERSQSEEEDPEDGDHMNQSGQQKMMLKYTFTDGEKNFMAGGSSTNKNTLSKLKQKKKGITFSSLVYKNNIIYCPTLG